jgi:trk system potassium uptake protein TrkH
MFLAGINFSLHFFALKGKFRKVIDNEELRQYMYLILTATAVIAISLIVKLDINTEQAIRDSLFQVVSIITTTGFITHDYLTWPSHLWLIIFLLMFTGGCAGSTGGGIKIVRIVLLFKNSRMELKRLIHPQALIPVRLNRKSISQGIIFNVLAFFLLYIVIFAFGSLIMSIIGLDFESAIGSVASSLGNIGPGLGSVGPVLNYGLVPDSGKWLLSFLMLLGRLELFTVLLLFSSSFWNR